MTDSVRGAALDPGLFRQTGPRGASIDATIVREIRALIAGGQLSPGDRLPAERDLARAFEVSRPSLREAMRRLAAMGLVEIRWGRGVYVRATDVDVVLGTLAPLMLDRGDVSHIYEIRRLVEVAGAGWAAERATAAERDQLRALADEAELTRERLAGDAELARELDRRYHNLIAALSHNPVLVRIMLGLFDLLGELRQRSFAIPGRALRSLEEHRAITDAILAGDRPAAREAMISHLERAENAIRTATAAPAADSL